MKWYDRIYYTLLNYEVSWDDDAGDRYTLHALQATISGDLSEIEVSYTLNGDTRTESNPLFMLDLQSEGMHNIVCKSKYRTTSYKSFNDYYDGNGSILQYLDYLFLGSDVFSNPDPSGWIEEGFEQAEDNLQYK